MAPLSLDPCRTACQAVAVAAAALAPIPHVAFAAPPPFPELGAMLVGSDDESKSLEQHRESMGVYNNPHQFSDFDPAWDAYLDSKKGDDALGDYDPAGY
jgi:hypothetical protein